MTIETSERRTPNRYRPPLVSWEDFLVWQLGQEQRFEWVDGEIIELMGDSIRHYLIVRFLSDLLRHFGEEPGLGLVLTSTILMRMRNRPSGRQPDVMYVAEERRQQQLTDTYLDGPANLAVEVVSPDSETRDRREKLLEYEAAGVGEYWLIDALRQESHFYVLDGTGKYREVPTGSDGFYASDLLPNLRIRVDWLWRDPLPKLAEALAELPS